MALADSNQLQQVLVNLALNARDATPRAALKPIAFRLRRQTPQGGHPGCIPLAEGVAAVAAAPCR